MKIVMIVVWMLQGGALQGSPWKYFDSEKACQDAIDVVQKTAWDDRFIFAAGCLDRELMRTFTGFYFRLTPAPDQQKR